MELYPSLWGFVMSGLVIYTIASLLIYLQSGINDFKYYAGYNFVLATFVITKMPDTPQLILDYYSSPWYAHNFLAQIVYNSLLFLFYNSFLDFKQHAPLFSKVLVRYINIVIPVGFVLFAYAVWFDGLGLYKTFFFFVFIPTIMTFMAVAVYITLRMRGYLKYFILTGIILYNVFAYTALYKSMNHDGGIPPMSYFCIGIILESIVFLLALGLKVKQIYTEKIEVQKKFLQEQIERQRLKDQYSDELEIRLRKQEVELREMLESAEKEKINTLQITHDKEISELRLESLRNQMNPHFVFNALNSIKAYILENEKENAVFYLNRFAKFIRKVLESSRAEFVSLEEEVNMLEIYVSIEKIRFEKEIEFAVHNRESAHHQSIKVPALITQPFVENAIWHGLMLMNDRPRKIDVFLETDNITPILRVVDNGIGLEEAAKRKKQTGVNNESLGLNLIQERLDYFNIKHFTKYAFKMRTLFDENGSALGTEVVLSLGSAESVTTSSQEP